MIRFARLLSRLTCSALIASVRVYQCCLSPLLGQNCRFYPTCSNYFIAAVQKHGPFSGTYRGLRRILRCHPLYRGNYYDPP